MNDRPNPTTGARLPDDDPLGTKLVAHEQIEVWFRSAQLVSEVWKRLVNAVGKARAKDIMRFVMGDKPMRRREEPINILIFVYIRFFGRHESDEKIAKRILDSKPCYVRYQSGEIGVVNNWMTEELLCGGKEIVDRWPINTEIPALKKQVERVRRQFIDSKLLPKEYAPRQYYRG